MTKTVKLDAIMNKTEMKAAIKLYKTAEHGTFAERCAAEIIRPVLDRINKATGQENDAKYLAYCVEFAILKTKGYLHA